MNSMAILNADAVLSPNRMHVGFVRAYMLFPNNEANRLKLIRRAAVEQQVELLAAGGLDSARTHDLVLRALDAISTDELRVISAEPEKLGYAAGMILYNSCIAAKRGEKAVLKQAKDDIDGVLGKQKNGTSKHVDEIVWKAFRSVAPLWAAFIWLEVRSKPAEHPCTSDDLPIFLKVSEAFRVLGETTKPFKSSAILSPGECYRLPVDVAALLPKGTFEIA